MGLNVDMDTPYSLCNLVPVMLPKNNLIYKICLDYNNLINYFLIFNKILVYLIILIYNNLIHLI